MHQEPISYRNAPGMQHPWSIAFRMLRSRLIPKAGIYLLYSAMWVCAGFSVLSNPQLLLFPTYCLMVGFWLGMEERKLAWHVSSLRAMGFGTSDIRRLALRFHTLGGAAHVLYGCACSVAVCRISTSPQRWWTAAIPTMAAAIILWNVRSMWRSATGDLDDPRTLSFSARYRRAVNRSEGGVSKDTQETTALAPGKNRAPIDIEGEKRGRYARRYLIDRHWPWAKTLTILTAVAVVVGGVGVVPQSVVGEGLKATVWSSGLCVGVMSFCVIELREMTKSYVSWVVYSGSRKAWWRRTHMHSRIKVVVCAVPVLIAIGIVQSGQKLMGQEGDLLTHASGPALALGAVLIALACGFALQTVCHLGFLLAVALKGHARFFVFFLVMAIPQFIVVILAGADNPGSLLGVESSHYVSHAGLLCAIATGVFGLASGGARWVVEKSSVGPTTLFWQR